MATHLRAYDENLTPLGLMPDHSELSVQLSYNDTGVLACKYLASGHNVGFLDRNVLYLTVLEDGVEQPWWFKLDTDFDDAVDSMGPNRMVDLTAPGVMVELDTAVVYPASHSPGESVDGKDPKHAFTQQTPGVIIGTLVNKAKARGAIGRIEMSFSATHDSAGQPWPKKYDVSYAAGTSYLKVVQAACDNGWIDARMNGFVLEAFVPDTVAAVDRPHVVFRTGQQVVAGPRKRSRRGIITTMLGVGAETNLVEVADSAATSKHGRREGFASDGRMTTNGSLRSMTQAELESRTEAKEGFTLAVAMTPPPHVGNENQFWWLPERDFHVGDKIRWEGRRVSPTELEPLRVRTITYAWGPAGAVRTCEIELNDVFVEAAIRLERRVTGITGGSVTTAPPAPAPPAPAPKDTTVPATPDSVTLEAELYATTDSHRVSVQATWPPVVANTDGSAYMDHDSYWVTWKLDDRPWVGWTKAEDSPWFLDDLPPGSTVQVRVMAGDTHGNRGVSRWSDPLVLPTDQVPPPKPAAVTVTEKLSALTVTSPGGTAEGGDQPHDYSHSLLHMLTEQYGEPASDTVVARFVDRGLHVAAGLPYDSPRWFVLVAYDREGNASEPSDPVQGVSHPLVDEDFAFSTVGDQLVAAAEASAAATAAAESANGAAASAEAVAAEAAAAAAAAAEEAEVASSASQVASADAAAALAALEDVAASTGQTYFQDTPPGGTEPAPVLARTNLVAYPSFETGLTGWGAGALAGLTIASSTRMTDGGVSGDCYWRQSFTGRNTGTPYFLHTHIDVVGGSAYTASIYVRPSATTEAYMRLWMYDEDLGPISDPAAVSEAVTIPGGEWTRLTVSLTLPAGVATARPSIQFPVDALPDGIVIDLDAASMVLGLDVDAPYFDGSTPDTDVDLHAWTGEPHASTSTLHGAPPEYQGADYSGNLWIDTTDGRNAPHRWTGPYTWEPITDASALAAADAAADAVVAAEAARAEAEAARTAADAAASSAQGVLDVAEEARSAANTAAKDAEDALLAAQHAQETADGKNTAYYQPTPPTGPQLVDDDLWYDTDDGHKPHRWVTADTEWVPAPFGDSAIANIDAGKISAGTIDAARIGAGSITAEKLNVGEFTNLATIDEDTGVLAHQWGTQVLTDDGWITRASTAGSYLMFTDQRGPLPFEPGDKLLFRFNAVAAAPTAALVSVWAYHRSDGSNVTASSSLNITTTEATYTVQVTVPTFNRVLFNEFILGLSGLQGDAVKVRRVRVTRMTGATLIEDGAVTTTKLSANAVTADKLEAGLVLSTKIIAGDEDGTHAEMAPTGFRVYRPGVDGVPDEVVRLGTTTDDYFGIVDAEGNLLSSINDAGVGSFKGLSVNGDLTYQGTELTTLLEEAGGGLVAYGSYEGSRRTGISSPSAVFDVTFRYQPGRIYKITALMQFHPTGTPVDAFLELRASAGLTPGQAVPSVNSPLLKAIGLGLTQATNYTTHTVSHVEDFANLNIPDGAYVRVLAAVRRGAGSGTLAIPETGVPTLIVEDAGPRISSSAANHPFGGSGGTSPRQTYTQQFNAAWQRSYKPDGAQYLYGGTRMYQGYYNSEQGDHSQVGFANLTDLLSGADVRKVEVYFNFAHWWYNSGGTARIGVHGNASAPAAVPSGGGTVHVLDSGGWPKPGGRWVDITSTAAGWKSGAYRGVSLDRYGSTNKLYYGYADTCYLRITYTK